MKITLAKLLTLTLTLVLILSMLTSCGMKSYSRLGISFELPADFEERAVAGALMAFGNDEAFVVFNKYTLGDLSKLGLSTLDVQNYTEKLLETTELVDTVEPTYSATGQRAVFSYVVQDPEVTDLYYYYYTTVIQGTGCIWTIQMACYDVISYEYEADFVKWAAGFTVE